MPTFVFWDFMKSRVGLLLSSVCKCCMGFAKSLVALLVSGFLLVFHGFREIYCCVDVLCCV